MHEQSLTKHMDECRTKMMKMEVLQQPASIYEHMHHSTCSFLFLYISQSVEVHQGTNCEWRKRIHE